MIKMCSNNIVNFQESTTILTAYTKMSVNLLKAPRMGIKYVAEPISESTPQMNFSLMRASSDNQRQ